MTTLIQNTRWERKSKESFQESYEPLQAAVEQGNNKGYDFNGLSQDLFSSLYQYDPKIPDSAPSQGTGWQHQIVKELSQLREYQDLRACGTMGDSFQAGLGSTVLSRQFAQSLQPMPEQNPDDLQDQIDMLEQFAKENPTDPKAQAAQAKAQKLAEKLPDAKSAWGQAQQDPALLRQALRRAIGQAKQEIAEGEQCANAYGYGNEPGKDGFINSAAKLALAEKIRSNPKLKEIALLAGRFRREARAIQSAKKQPGPDEINSIETGNSLERCLPSELAKLSNKWRKLEFFKNYLENSIMQYHLESTEKLARGPIIVCIDNSGSMSGQREIWSKSISLALCQVAVDSKRDFAVIHFSNEVNQVHVFEHKNGGIDPAKLVELMEYFNGGGTNFDKPIESAIELIKNSTGAIKQADIIFITDGDCELTEVGVEALTAAKVATGCKLLSVIIGSYSETLKEVSDHYTEVSDLTDTDQAKETLFSI
jgi:uncharacterized protein with von Willebrand factor type A (vWA) domain